MPLPYVLGGVPVSEPAVLSSHLSGPGANEASEIVPSSTNTVAAPGPSTPASNSKYSYTPSVLTNAGVKW